MNIISLSQHFSNQHPIASNHSSPNNRSIMSVCATTTAAMGQLSSSSHLDAVSPVFRNSSIKMSSSNNSKNSNNTKSHVGKATFRKSSNTSNRNGSSHRRSSSDTSSHHRRSSDKGGAANSFSSDSGLVESSTSLSLRNDSCKNEQVSLSSFMERAKCSKLEPFDAIMPNSSNNNKNGSKNSKEQEKGERKEKSSLRRGETKKSSKKTADSSNSKTSSISATKNTSSATTTSETPKTLSKKHVHFNDSENQVYEIQSIEKYAKDLWWTLEECEQAEEEQADLSKLDDVYQQDVVDDYIEAYTESRFRNTNSTTTKFTIPRAAEIHRGIQEGYLALEVFASIHDDCIDHIRLVVQAIVAASEIHGGTSLRSFSQSLTKNDRKWALFMGRLVSSASD